MLDQPGKVANPARRGQLNRENEYFPVPVRAECEFGLARRVCLVVPSRVRLVISILTGFLPISAAASIYLNRHAPSGQSRVYWVITQ